jgi:hypothetical protein
MKGSVARSRVAAARRIASGPACAATGRSRIARAAWSATPARSTKADKTPERLLRRQIRSGQWGFRPLRVIEADMWPRAGVGQKDDLEARILACIEYSITEPRGKDCPYRDKARLAVIKDPKKGWRVLQPVDIERRLEAYGPLKPAEKEAIRKKIREWEKRGRLKVYGETRGHVHIFFYFKPLPCGRQHVKNFGFRTAASEEIRFRKPGLI